MQTLVDQLNAQCDEQSFETGWYLKNLAKYSIPLIHVSKIYPTI